MTRFYKKICFMFVFIITFIACSGCFGVPTLTNSVSGEVGLISVPSTTTVRFMDESIYIGYLGAQRDFALIVDNAGYTLKHKTLGCGDNESIGCASTMTKLLMNYGIKTSNFTGVSGAENLLLYYVSSTDFSTFGAADGWYDYLTGKNYWYDYLTDTNYSNPEYSDFNKNDTILGLSCGIKGIEHPQMCDYANDMTKQGYSARAGNSMILLFHNGNLSSIITDKSLDPDGKLNDHTNPNFDKLAISNQDNFEEYYNAIIKALRSRIHVTNTTNTRGTGTGSKQELNSLNSLRELENLIDGDYGQDYLLLIVADGFIQQKIGTNHYLDENGKDSSEATFGEGMTPSQQAIKLLYNEVSSYIDNCAVESSEMLNYLKSFLQGLAAGTIGAVGGAAIGSGIGALVGTVVPVIGTGIGAVVGAIIGAIVGAAAGLFVNAKIEEEFKSANGISDTSYCRIAESALDSVEINVPIYVYSIDSATDNIKAYKNGKMNDSTLKNYYNNNSTKCLTQYQDVLVPSGFISFFADNLDDSYKYADSCELKLVESIAGRVSGSPSIQLHLNGKKVDDLNGRITTEFINEMMSVWGLKSIGDLYNIASSSTLKDMSVTLGSAQNVKNMGYCISESTVPSCEETISVSTNNTYVGALNKKDGITLNFIDQYMQYSKQKTEETFTDTQIDSMTLNLIANKEYHDYYFHELNSKDAWSRSINNSGDSMADLLSTIKDRLKEERGNMYQVKYGSYNYLISSDETLVVGYYTNSQGKMNIVYYADTSVNDNSSEGSEDQEEETDNILKEYVFIGSLESFEDNKYFDYTGILTNKTTNIDSAHDFYVYIQYDIKDSDGADTTAYYSYIV